MPTTPSSSSDWPDPERRCPCTSKGGATSPSRRRPRPRSSMRLRLGARPHPVASRGSSVTPRRARLKPRGMHVALREGRRSPPIDWGPTLRGAPTRDMTDTPRTRADRRRGVFEQKAVRLAKRERLIAERTDAAGGAYPVSLPITDTIPALRERFADLEAGAETGVTAAVAGRVVFSRNTGKLCFATLQAGDGSRIQAMVSLAAVGDESLQAWKELVDLGDHVFVAARSSRAAAASCRSWSRSGASPRRRSCRCRTCTPSSARRAGSAAASSISSCAIAPARPSSPAPR